MASFTDQISQFNPYIQELPVEAMAQVGMAKQAQYDQGVKKVQNYIDRVAGLEIAKPQHKQYLQSKMDELGNRLKTVAAGDFSNQQLVNSVSGMTGQIIKDPVVQNAVYSTQVLKKGEADREIASKAGKTSPANDDLWNDTKNDWFNNQDLNTPFNGRYIERWDVDKKLVERAEKILKNPDVITQEQRFKHDEKGNTLYYGTEPVKDKDGKVVTDPKTKKPVLRETVSLDPSKGQPVEDDAILKISVKGVSPEKLYNNFLDALDSKDAQQLRIDARYKYKNATAASFAPDIAKFYGEKKAFQSQEIVNLAVALAEPNLAADQKAALTARMTDLQQQQKDGVIEKEFNATMQALKDPRNLEKYKEDIYTQQHLMNMAKDMSFKSYEQEIKNNPYMQMFMQKQNYNLDVMKFKDDSRIKWANYNLAVRKEDFDEFASNREFAYKVKKDKAENPDPIITTTTLPTETTVNTVDEQWKVASDESKKMQALKGKYASRLFPGMTAPEQQKAFDKLFERYETDPHGKYSPDEQEFLEQHRKGFENMMAASNLAKAAEKATTEKEKELMSKYASKGAGGFTGEEIMVGKKEIGNWIMSNVAGNPRETGAITSEGVWNAEKIKQHFKSKGLEKLLPIVDAFDKDQTRGLFGWSNIPKTATDKEILEAMSSSTDGLVKVTDERDAFTKEYIAKNTPKKTAQDMALDMSDEKTKSAVNKYLTSVAVDDLGIGAGDAKTVLEWTTGEDGGKIKGVVRKRDDGTTETVWIKPDGSEQITLPMNYDKQQFFPEVRQSSPYGYLKNYIEISPNRTSDLMNNRSAQANPVNAVNAPLTGFDVPGLAGDPSIAPLVRFTIEGNHDNDGSSKDTYLLNMFLKDPKSNGWKAGTITPRYVPWGGIENILNNVGKDAYYEGLKTWK